MYTVKSMFLEKRTGEEHTNEYYCKLTDVLNRIIVYGNIKGTEKREEGCYLQKADIQNASFIWHIRTTVRVIGSIYTNSKNKITEIEFVNTPEILYTLDPYKETKKFIGVTMYGFDESKLPVISIQSLDMVCSLVSLDSTGQLFPNGKCNFNNAKSCYERLFSDYNAKMGTNFDWMFFAFSDLCISPLDLRDECVFRASEMIGGPKSESEDFVLLLEVPKNICLQTDFYNYTDQVYKNECDDGSVTAEWGSIYEDRNSEKQTIFPYIMKDWVIDKRTMSRKEFKEYYDKRSREFFERINSEKLEVNRN